MTRFIMPIILIAIGVTVFFAFTNPIYNDIGGLRAQVAAFDQALDNSKALYAERDILTEKKNSINPDNLTKIQKLLPNNVDNIRLILEIEQIALPYGMVLRDIKYSVSDAEKEAASAGGVVQGGGAAEPAFRDYGVWDLEFSTIGTYNNFLNFTRDLESNLRIVDISSIQFSSDTPSAGSSQSYTYNFKIKTYWLKN